MILWYSLLTAACLVLAALFVAMWIQAFALRALAIVAVIAEA